MKTGNKTKALTIIHNILSLLKLQGEGNAQCLSFSSNVSFLDLTCSNMMRCLLILLGINLSIQTAPRWRELFNWKQIDFELKANEKKNLIEAGQWIPGNSIPTSIAKWSDKLFFAIPRLKPGVPASLAYISLNNTGETQSPASPIFIPYPDRESHDLSSKNITSITCIEVDVCDRLWAIDSGQIEQKRETTAAIIVFDLKSNIIIESYKLLMKTEYKFEPFLSDIAIDVTSSNCDNPFIYVPDANNNEIIILNWKTQDIHKVTHNYFHFDPLYGNIKVDNIQYRTNHGIYSLAMSPVGRDDHRLLFFNPLASSMEFAISTKHLQNKSLDADKSFYDFKIMGSRGLNSQSSSSTFDEETGVLFYTLITKNAIGCWNSFSGDEYEEKTQGIIIEDTNLIYPADVEADRNGAIWILTNNLPRFLYGVLSKEEPNFRIITATMRSIIKGTACDNM